MLSSDDQTVHLTLADGTTEDALISPSSLFLKDGLAVPPSAFPAGAKALLRARTRASDGEVSVVMLCDAASAGALDAYRKKTLVGTVQSLDDKTLVVKPAGGGTPVTLRLTPKTLCRKRGADASAAAFAPGSSVAVITRGLPSGLLMAALVSDAPADADRERALLKPVRLSGHVLDVQPDQNLLTVAALKPKGRRVIAVGTGHEGARASRSARRTPRWMTSSRGCILPFVWAGRLTPPGTRWPPAYPRPTPRRSGQRSQRRRCREKQAILLLAKYAAAPLDNCHASCYNRVTSWNNLRRGGAILAARRIWQTRTQLASSTRTRIAPRWRIRTGRAWPTPTGRACPRRPASRRAR